jgi:agmatine deiminase
MAGVLAHFEPVRVLVEPGQIAEVQRMISRAPALDGNAVRMDRIELLPVPTNDSWIRDYGPIFLNGHARRQLATDWRFNSWGEKYRPYELDDAVPHRLAERYGFEVVQPGIVLEGGSLDVNGRGSLLTTEACLLNRNRNPALRRAEIEEYLRVYLGLEQILWLGDGIAGDDTDGHIDDLARFVSPDTIVTVVEPDPAEVNYAPLQDNLKRLRAMHGRNGKPFRIEVLPMPPPLYHEQMRLPASYANFYIANGAVLMPSFGCPADEVATTTLQPLFPSRCVIAIPSTHLVLGLGAIHCLTMQHPSPAASEGIPG